MKLYGSFQNIYSSYLKTKPPHSLATQPQTAASITDTQIQGQAPAQRLDIPNSTFNRLGQSWAFEFRAQLKWLCVSLLKENRVPHKYFLSRTAAPQRGAWGRGLRRGGPSPGGPKGLLTPQAASRRAIRGGRPPSQGRGPSPTRMPLRAPHPSPGAAGGRPLPPSPALPLRRGPGAAPIGWPWQRGPWRLATGHLHGRWAAGDWRLAPLGVRAEGAAKEPRRSRGGSGFPPARAGNRPGTGFTCASGFDHHHILAVAELRSSTLIIDFCLHKVVSVARGRRERRKHYSLPINKSLGVCFTCRWHVRGLAVLTAP